MNKKLLVIEDDPGLRSQLKWCFENFEVLQAEDMETAARQLEKHNPSVVTLDLGLPPDPGGVTVGLSILEKIITDYPETKVIVVTGQEDRENALKAISMGAYDFFHKPIDAKILPLVAERAYHLHQIEHENRVLQEQKNTSPLDGVITSSPAMLKVCEMVEKIAPSNLSALIFGESGTGKELIARAIHRLSGYSEGNFVAINCAAIPENLLESELFGHEKGSFTGATSQKKGKVEMADGGTLFLDEIGDMPVELQSKVLRFLQERVIERVGGTKEIPVDVRVVCATHRPMNEMIQEKSFREDLYFRISDITIELPPLRERDDDIVVLARVFLEKYATEQGKKIHGLSQATENTLLDYECRGNVRELEKIIRRAVIMTEESYLQPQDLQLKNDPGRVPENDDEAEQALNLALARSIAEKRTILRALDQVEGNISKAAKLLEISRPTLYSLIERLKIEIDE
ncbi:MAG: PEP-CTERM-box response regulator transcription factor [Gammaproteobacteria bacterium]|nr:PEP-CTERM-box response regulator transcription factor [Gammaproteobacteria bacterium]